MTETTPAKAVQLLDATKTEPTEAQALAIATARERGQGRRKAPTALLFEAEGKTAKIVSPHRDQHGFAAQLCDTFGTASDEFTAARLSEVVSIISAGAPDAGSVEPQINDALATIHGIAPEDETESMLAVQMASTHALAVNMMRRLAGSTNLDHMERYGTLTNKLLRTYTTQMEALAKHRRGGSQNVTVEHIHKHMHVHAEHAAGGYSEKGNQPHAPTDPKSLAFTASLPMYGENPGGDTLPIPCSEGQGTLQDARRGKRERGA